MKTTKRTLLPILFILTAIVIACGIFLFNQIPATAEVSGNNAPTIIVDMGDYDDNNIPNACVNVDYEVFFAKAKSYAGKDVDVQTKVYIYYYSQTASQISLVNNKFTPKHYGVYTVEYTATDDFGSSVVTYDVTCEEKEPLSVAFVGGEDSGVCGSVLNVAELTFENFSGKTKYSVSVAKLKDTDIAYDIIDGKFVPLYAGEYVIEYNYSDYNESGIASYTVEVSSVQTPVITKEVTFPKYMLVGYEYNLPEITCYNFSNGQPVEVSPKIEVLDANNLINDVSDEKKFVPSVEGATKITYTFTVGNKKVERDFLVMVVDVKFNEVMSFDKYFYSEIVRATELKDYVQLSTENDGKSEFVNALPSKIIETRFSWKTEKVNFDKFNVYFTDSVAPSKSIKITFSKKSDGSIALLVNDDVNSAVQTSNAFNRDGAFTLNFNETNKKISLAGDVSVVVSRYLSGELFDGFDSEKVYISYEFIGVKGQSCVNIETIDNQAICKVGGDGVEPYTLFSKYSHGEHKVGDVVTIDRIYVGDVLCPELFQVDYGILSPSGSFIVFNEGIDYTKPYTFTVEEVGKYNVHICAVDIFGNESNYSYAISVVDDVAPVITLNGTNKSEYSFGSTVSFAKATAIDQLDGEVSVFVYVITPNLQVINVSKDYKINHKGKHTLVYYAFDSVGNYVQIKNEFIVK